MKLLECDGARKEGTIQLSLNEIGALVQCVSEICSSGLIVDGYDFDLGIGMQKAEVEQLLGSLAEAFDLFRDSNV
jgi:hypothetical protein